MNRKLVNENGRYAIFYVDTIINGKGIPSIKYHYFENGIRINGSFPCESVADIQKGDVLFGKYRPQKSESIICCYCTVPIDIAEQPKEGWSSIPDDYCQPQENFCLNYDTEY